MTRLILLESSLTVCILSVFLWQIQSSAARQRRLSPFHPLLFFCFFLPVLTVKLRISHVHFFEFCDRVKGKDGLSQWECTSCWSRSYKTFILQLFAARANTVLVLGTFYDAFIKCKVKHFRRGPVYR